MYRADDGNCEITVNTDNPRTAAEEYVRTGQWDHAEPGATVTVHVWPAEPMMSMREADDAGLLTSHTVEIA
jgi:hypothetical protein